MQLFGQAVQLAGQAAGQVVKKFARHAEDFYVFPNKSKQVQRTYTVAEVQKCTGQNGGCLYIVYDDKVLDLTEFAPFHCGGSAVLLKYGGTDASAAMRSSGMPPQVFEVFLQRFVIGRVVRSSTRTSVSSSMSSSVSTPPQSPAPTQNCGWIPALTGLCKK